MIEEKCKLRKEYIEIRKNIKNKNKKSNDIFKRVIALKEYKNSNIIALYKSLDSEVDTNKLIEYSLNNNKVVVLPRVVGNNLKFYKINSLNDKLEKSEFGVLEPIIDQENFVDASKIDLVIVPGVCFDASKNRIGFGKGFYDRFLNETKAKSIAICFEEQVLKDKTIPVEKNDIKIDKIVTEKDIYI